MNRVLASVVLLGLTALAWAQRTEYGQPFSISGVPAEPLNATVSSVKREGRTLSLEVGSARLVIAPMPEGLDPFPFAGSTVRAQHRDHPDSQEVRLEFKAPDSQILVVGSQTSSFSSTIGNWRFEARASSMSARLRLENRSAYLRLGRTTRLRDDDLIWCVHLVALHLPEAAKPGVAQEAEGPRFDWTALQVGSTGRCPTP